MKIVICLSALIGVALACPTTITTKTICECSTLPTFISNQLQIVQLDSGLAGQLFNGVYYLGAAVPTHFNNHALKVSLLGNTFPAGGSLFSFYDNTPTKEGDIEYLLASYSYNCMTGDVDRTLSLLNSALGPNSNVGVLNLYLEAVYESTLLDETIIGCKSFIERTVEQQYSQRVIIALIGYQVDDYILFAVIDKWTNSIFGSQDIDVFALTRSPSPSKQTVENIINDLEKSGIKPHRLWFMDQSINLTDLPGYITPSSLSRSSLSSSALSGFDDVEGQSLTSTSTSKVSTSSIDSSSLTSTIRSTTSVSITTDFVINPEYKPFSPFVSNPLLNGYKCLNDFDESILDAALSGKYYVFATTPTTSGDCQDTGFFSTSYPTTNLQILFDNSTPLGPNGVRMMYDRSINVRTEAVTCHKSLLYLPLGLENSGIIGLWTEAYKTSSSSSYKSLFDFDESSFVFHPDYSQYYEVQHLLAIIGYGDDYLILLGIDVADNLFFTGKNVNNVFVLTRDSAPTVNVVGNIIQDLLQNNIDLYELMRMCQTQDILEDYSFDASDFYVDIEIKSSSTTTIKSSVSYSSTSDSC
ncbi:uncharacterized protein LOC126836043 [Adelges cooleyi]|uniref:uncharacterized protein LOC126836043 n=1 Tax=Adelges cooleyi TaxID=133065 RepID=UPI00217F9D31|nr:uncharacterized protein LOC126836043 [Adelges cooleyi]